MVCSETPSRCNGADRLADTETCVAYDRGMAQQVIVQLAQSISPHARPQSAQIMSERAARHDYRPVQ